MAKSRDKVRDGYFRDLPEEVKNAVMEVHKLLVKTIKEQLDEEAYQDLKKSRWAMSCIDEFKAMPTDKGKIGSIRVFKKGKKYDCMIQLTGHFQNHEYGWIEELLHDFIKDVFITVKAFARRKYDMRMENEGDHGSAEEGFDIYAPVKLAEQIWFMLEDSKTKTITESGEVEEDEDEKEDKEEKKEDKKDKDITESYIQLDRLPMGLIETIKDINATLYTEMKKLTKDEALLSASNISSPYVESGTGCTSMSYNPEGYMDGFTIIMESNNKKADRIYRLCVERCKSEFESDNPGKFLEFVEGDENKSGSIIVSYEQAYLNNLLGYLQNPITEAAEEDKEEEPTPSYNVEMTEAQAKKTLRSLSQGIINDEKHKVSQYTANIYANIITKNLLPKWAKGFKKFSITLDSYQSFYTFEFKIPKMSDDFISRYIDGKEPLNAFLHRIPEIKVKMSPRIFGTMKEPDDAFNFFKAAIQYYDSKVDRYARSLNAEVMRLNTSMKHLIGTTKLSGMVTYPMKLLFTFDDVKMDNRKTFELSQDDIKTVNQFVRNIYTRYAAPEKEKNKIIEDVKDMVKELREATTPDENMDSLRFFPEAVQDYLFGKFDKEMDRVKNDWIKEQVDLDYMKSLSYKDKVMYEKFGVKKLKKIPVDTVAYITIEAESIKDANDKMMIASYCLSKIEIVEWYIELLEVGSNKYVVPHNKPYLESLRTQLLACYKKIMDTPIPKARPLIDIQYPKGYQG